MGKKINLQNLYDVKKKKVEHKEVDFVIGEETFTVKFQKDGTNEDYSNFVTNLIEYIDENKELGIEEEPLFWIAILETFTDIDFSGSTLPGKIGIISELVDNGTFIEIIESVPEGVLQHTTELMQKLTSFLKKEFELE